MNQSPRYIWKTLNKDAHNTQLSNYYDTPRTDLLALLSRNPQRVLELGCGSGATGAWMKKKYPGVELWGVEPNVAMARYASEHFYRVVPEKIEDMDLWPYGLEEHSVDTVILAGVLENLVNPWNVLEQLHRWLTEDVQILISLPNTRNLWLLNELAAGRFQYDKWGIIDITYLRFFTREDGARMLIETGYDIKSITHKMDNRFANFEWPISFPCNIDTDQLQIKQVDEDTLKQLTSVQFFYLASSSRRRLEIYTEKYPVSVPSYTARARNEQDMIQKPDGTIRTIAFYLPQFHAIKENDKWWGEGFTEWVSAASGKPQFNGHYQPHIPDDALGEYNLLDSSVFSKQIDLAKQYGVDGFCFYIYWFGGKRLLEEPILNYLSDSKLDFPFCLCWANENWTRRWDGLESDILISQNHSPEDDIRFIEYYSQFITDQRYIKIDGKPLIIVYRPSILPDPRATAQRWRTWCRENGIGDIYLTCAQTFGTSDDPENFGFDAALEFPPHNVNAPQVLYSTEGVVEDFQGTVYDWRYFIDITTKYVEPSYKLFRTLCPSWDNTARKKNRGAIFINSDPHLFSRALFNAFVDTRKRFSLPDERIVFINAWNEWGEGAHLEPDKLYGYAWLQAVLDAHLQFAILAKNHAQEVKSQTSVEPSNVSNVLEKCDLVSPESLYSLTHSWLGNFTQLPVERIWVSETITSWTTGQAVQPHIALAVYPNEQSWLLSTQSSIQNQWLSFRQSLILHLLIDAKLSINDVNSVFFRTNGEWLALIDSGDLLAEDALFRIDLALRQNPQWQMLYTDEDSLTAEGEHVNPHCKPDFNLDYLRSLPYVGGLMLIKKTLFDALGGFDPQAEGAEDYDFMLRAWEHVGDAGIGHIPEVLYHRRQGSSHCNKSVPEILEAGKQALQRHLQRLDIAAEVLSGPFPPSFRVRYPLSTTPLVSMVIPTRNQLGFLQRCIESIIEKTRYPNYEILIVDNNSDDPETCTYLDLLTAQEESMGGRLRVLRYPGAFNFSAMNNRAVDAARGDHILLLNNDTAVLHEDWLDEMVSHILRPEVGVVGAKLFYPDGKIQHAGVILGMRGPAEHPFIGHPPEDRGYFGRAMLTQNYSAVTGACLLISKSLYQEVGGLDEKHFKVSYNDVDLCLKVREAGHKIVWTPWAMLLHEGSASQKGDVEPQADKNKLARFAAEKTAFYDRWLPQLAFDPAYNRHLSLASTDFLLEDQAALTWDPEWRPRPRILVHPADREGCGEYRIISPMRALNAAGKVQGWETMRIFEPAEMTRFSPESMVLQRQMEWPQIEALERHKRFSSAFRVFEIDDLITNLPVKSVHKGQIHKDIAKRFRKAASLCDRLVVATEPLAQAYKGYSDEVRVQPNYVERAVWGDLLPNRRGGVKPRVGWAGGVGHTGDLELVADVVRDLAQEVDWVFFGLCPEALRPYVHEFYAGVPLSQYPAQLASLDLDLAIAPLEINAFNDAKSHLRILEYGVLGFPVVCSDITPYQGDFPVWRVANRYRDWMKTIREAVSDRTALAMAGDALRAHVQSHWMLEDHLDDWLKVWLP